MHNLPSVGELASFLVPGMICSLLSGSKVQLSSCWLLPRYKYHYHTFRDILLCRSLLWFIGFTAEQGYWLMWVILIKLSSVGWASIPGSPVAVHLSLNTENKLCSNELPFLGTQFVQLGSPGLSCGQPVFLWPGVTLDVCTAGLTLASFYNFMSLAVSPNDRPTLSHIHWWNVKQFSPTKG